MELIKAVLENQVFSGFLGGSVIAYVFYALRTVPIHLKDFLLRTLTVELTIYNEDSAFDLVSEWLSSLSYAKKARKLRLERRYLSDEKASVLCSPGLGHHFVWYLGRLLWVHRYIPEDGAKSASWQRREDIVVRTFGRSTEQMHDLIATIAEERERQRKLRVEIFHYNEFWRLVGRKAKRSLNTIFLPDDQKKRIVQDIDRFRSPERREWYLTRGIPYRRGFLLEGPPGCGKTSLVFALAAYLNRAVYVLNLGSLKNDNVLLHAMSSVPDDAILLIEDIDATKASEKRSDENDSKKDEPHQITLSALLNSIDGIFARDGRILFMTTNHPELIDDALLRKGRADRREHIGELGPKEATYMCCQFLGDEQGQKVAETIKTPICPSDLQEILLEQDAA